MREPDKSGFLAYLAEYIENRPEDTQRQQDGYAGDENCAVDEVIIEMVIEVNIEKSRHAHERKNAP